MCCLAIRYKKSEFFSNLLGGAITAKLCRYERETGDPDRCSLFACK
jgi:hypothetical protein